MTPRRFPQGGPHEPVYQILRDHGYTIRVWGDTWARHDGRVAHIYGAWSRLRITDTKSGRVVDAPIEEALREG
jgi:hypothetical protein